MWGYLGGYLYLSIYLSICRSIYIYIYIYTDVYMNRFFAAWNLEGTSEITGSSLPKHLLKGPTYGMRLDSCGALGFRV